MSSLESAAEVQPTARITDEPRVRSVSPGRRTVKRFFSHRLAMIGAIILVFMTICAILAPLLAPYDPNAIDLRKISQSPSWDHWFGTDKVGRDILSRVLYGARVSLSVGVVAVSIYLTIGFLLGAIAGYVGGFVDSLIMRFTDIMMCFPTFVLILILVGITGPNIFNIMLIIGLFGWPGIARLVRGQVLQLRELDYVLAARALGGTNRYVMLKHILPNVIGPLTVAGSLGIAGAILAEAGLSFLGLGVVAPMASWGAMLSDARNPSTMATQPWLWITPGLLISLAVLSANFIGDGLRDAFDVKSRLRR
ncbi:MAG: ABC transporter permease [Thermomicrobiales bacterium]